MKAPVLVTTLFSLHSYQAFFDHSKVAVHLRHFNFGSSETRPSQYLLLDRVEHRLYALPVRLAQQFLQQQWLEQDRSSEDQTGMSVPLQVASGEDLAAALDLDTWHEVTPSDDFNAQVMTAMRKGQLVQDLVAWLNRHKSRFRSGASQSMSRMPPPCCCGTS
jgi:hypothetical protein